jgi:hypothetical protein
MVERRTGASKKATLLSNASSTEIPPGEACQFDWSHEEVILGGVSQKVKVAHFRLCHSRIFFAAAYPKKGQVEKQVGQSVLCYPG